MPQFQFDAYQAYQNLKERYVNYLLESFGIDSTHLGDRLRRSWTEESDDHFRLFAPLHVEGAFPFKPRKTVEQLQAPGGSCSARTKERPLHPKTVQLLTNAGFDFELYDHQVEAIQKASTGDSIVLSAGTGSGKTEAFLIPLIDQLFWAHEQERDDLSEPGVRAIIIYPLNALVNNQIQRLRELLSGQTEINFAFYTSRLTETHRRAKKDFNTRGRELPPNCQIVDRQTLRGLDGGKQRPKGPPHILVTNYSMLEYMLVRPKDRSIFLNQHLSYKGSPRLQSIVLDEAHVYEGAQAAEIHMLLRRAARRFGTELEALQGFATSATLRQGEQSGSPLKKYAGDMFATPKDQVAEIEGERYLPTVNPITKSSSHGLTPPSDLPDDTSWIADELRTLEYDAQGRLTALLEDERLANLAKRACVCLGVSNAATADEVHDEVGDEPAKVIYHLFAANKTLTDVRTWLFEREKLPALDDVACKLYVTDEPTERTRRAAHAVLRLGSLGRSTHNRHPFLPTRMHAMVRAPLGIWVDPNPDNVDESAKESQHNWPWGQTYAIPPTTTDMETLQLLACRTCGAPFLLAWEYDDDFGEDVLSAHEKLDATPLALLHNEEATFRLPEKWGRIPVDKLKFKDEDPTDGGRLKDHCPSCEKDNARISPLRRSAASALGAIVDGIYPYLGEHPQSEEEPHLPGKGRRMMTFSDSRQGAAKVASNVEATHDIGVNRQLIWKFTKHDETLKVSQLIQDLYNPELLQRAPANQLEDLSNPAFEDLARLAVFDEFARPPARGRTLETMGLIEVIYPKLPQRPDSVSSFMSTEQWKALLAVILDDARRRGAVRRPTISHEGRQFHLQQLRPRFIGQLLTLSSGVFIPPGKFKDEDEDGVRTIPLVPAQEHHRKQSRIVHYVGAVLEALGAGDFDGVKLLRQVWSILLDCATDYRFRWLRPQDVAGKDKKGISIDLERLQLRPHPNGPKYIEPITGRVHFRSIKGISPIRDAPGPLKEITDEQRQEWRKSHSVKRVRDSELLGLYSVEHTAQLDVDELEREEEAFRQGERNLLASSTTMELGVDLGGLTCVVLTNVPPGPANYWQRAGRAGRRADGSSLVLTLGLDRPHDQKVFRRPLDFFHDEITPPRVRLDTPPLIARHVNSFLLSRFFQAAVEPDESGGPMKSFGSLESFVFESARDAGGIREAFRKRLGISPQAPLEEAYYRWLEVLGENSDTVLHLRKLVNGTLLGNWTTSELLAESRKAMENATGPARQDHDVIEAQIQREESKGEAQQDKGYLKALSYQKAALRKEHFIGYLARKNFLPRFGFPLEVVKLNTQFRLPKKYRDGDQEPDPRAVPDLRMERQLEIALREYAPGSDVLAGKRVHRVQGLERNWFQEDAGTARQRFYLECEKCGNVEDRDAALRKCPLCGHSAVQKDEYVSNMKAGSDVSATDSDALFGPDELADSLVRPYLKPSGFSVKVGRTPKRAERVRRINKMPPAQVTFSAPEGTPAYSVGESSSRMVDSLPNRLEIKYTSDATVFVRAEGNPSPRGHGWGFAICQACGFTEPEESWGGPLPRAYQGHRKLRGKKRCGGSSSVWRNAVLGTTQDVDAVEFRLKNDLYPESLEPEDQRAFFATLASCLKQVAAQRLQVDARTLSALVGTYSNKRDDYRLAAVIYEESGSGLLEHLCDDALELLTEVAVMLEHHQDDAAFIQFDSQFLAKYGRFRVDLLRRHFVEDGRSQWLERDDEFDHDKMRLLRGASPHMKATRLLKSRQSVALQAHQLADDAFGKDGLMRAVHQRVLDPNNLSTRLILTQLPDPDADDVEQLYLARKLRSAIDDGLHLRVLDDDLGSMLNDNPWEVLTLRNGYRQAIGGFSVTGDTPDSDGQKRGAFGSQWLSNRQAVEATGQGVDDACEMHELLWESARSVEADELVSDAAQDLNFVDIAAGSRFKSHGASLDELLSKRAGLGDLASLGEVKAIAYADRYVIRRVTSMWMLRTLLEQFEYAPDARGFVISLSAPQERSYNASRAKTLLNSTQPKDQLSRQEAQNMERSVSTTLRNHGLKLSFEKPSGWLPHPRKLMVRFSDTAELDTLRIRFEKGLDFLSPVSGTKSWTEREQATDKTFLLVEKNPTFTSQELKQLDPDGQHF